MRYHAVLVNSYRTAVSRRFLRMLGFTLAVFGTLHGLIYLGYQSFLTWIHVSGEHVDWAGIWAVIWTAAGRDWGGIAMGGSIILGLLALYLLLPPLLRGALVSGLAKISRGEKTFPSDALAGGLMAYLPLFEHDLLMSALSIVEIVTVGLFGFRNLPEAALDLILIPLVVVTPIVLVARFLFIYAEFFIIIEEDRLAAALRKSTTLVIRNLRHTAVISFMIMLVTIGMVLNLAIALAIPAGVGWLLRTFAERVPAETATLIGAGVGLVAFFLAVQIFGRATIFMNAIWVRTFLRLRSGE